METAAVYFPSWHRDPLNDRWYGDGWSEWRLMEQARPLFPGHEQPKCCTWGSFDEADPCWMEKQIDLAADHGITCFLFDWYWYGGRKFLYRPLEEGFLRARNRERLKFFVMWANHTWGVFPACREIFRGHAGQGARVEGQALSYDRPLLEIQHTLADLERVAEYCCTHYLHEPNYLRIGDQPVFSIWRWEELETQLGSVAAVAEGFARMRRVARRHGFPGLHFMVNIANYENPDTLHCWWPGLVERVKDAGGDSVFGYNVSRTAGYAQLPNARPIVPYAEVVASHAKLFRLCENRSLPFHPVATVGFDNTPRWHRGATLPVDFRRHHYEPVVVDNTPAAFQGLLQTARASIERCGGGTRMLLINAWNEWSEGCHLLPEQRYGLGYLEAVRAAVDAPRRAAP